MNTAQKEVLMVMGSQSDFDTMVHAHRILEELKVSHDWLIVSAHRTPERLQEVASTAAEKGYKVIIAGAGGAAHLPGMMASFARTIPVLGVPVKSSTMSGLDSLYSIVQMPGGVPVATFAIGEAGAKNAAYFAVQMLGISDARLRRAYELQRTALSASVELNPKFP